MLKTIGLAAAAMLTVGATAPDRWLAADDLLSLEAGPAHRLSNGDVQLNLKLRKTQLLPEELALPAKYRDWAFVGSGGDKGGADAFRTPGIWAAPGDYRDLTGSTWSILRYNEAKSIPVVVHPVAADDTHVAMRFVFYVNQGTVWTPHVFLVTRRLADAS